ncbi:hypothetical protein ACM0BF_14305 [Mycobacteroides abscessus subsp. abscessus]|uniref:hypothetical protein n=1 Tax=Mycobacteroides abscessus TaxID=36809 RepID=UPI0039F08912
MKLLVASGITVLALLASPVASADPQPNCEWTPDLDVSQCDFIVGVPPTGELVSEPRGWSSPETRTK